MRRPTKGFFILLGIGLLLVLAGSTAQAGWLFVLAAGVAGVLGASVVVPHGLSGLRLDREVPPAVTVGDEVQVRVMVTNEGRRAAGLTRVSDRIAGLDQAALLLERCEPGAATMHATVARKATHRGVFAGGEFRLEAGPPFGLLIARRTVPAPSVLVVKPRTVMLDRFPLSASSTAPASALRERPRVGMGEEFLSVRHYRPGDPMRSIHWRSTARVGRLVVREYEEMAQERCTILLAGEDRGTPPDSAFEAAVSAAASIGLFALQHRHPLELVRFDESGTPVRLSRPSPEEMLVWLAGAVPHEGGVATLLERATIESADTVVLVVSTPEVLPDSLPEMPVVGVVARPTTWGGAAVPDSPAEIRARLRAPGEIRLLERNRELVECLRG